MTVRRPAPLEVGGEELDEGVQVARNCSIQGALKVLDVERGGCRHTSSFTQTRLGASGRGRVFGWRIDRLGLPFAHVT
jgi:hypothetical protein